jgi:DNA polymerase-3 subunit beta
MEIAVSQSIAAETEGNGAFTAPVGTVLDIVKRFDKSACVTLEHDGGDGQLALKSGRYRTSLVTIDAADFPAVSAGAFPHNFAIPAQTLRILIDSASYAISHEETRYQLNGIYLHVYDGKLRAVATDGHRLARAESELPEGAANIPGVILPRKFLGELRKLAEVDGFIDVSLSDTRIQVSTDGVTLTSKLIDGTFPEYERVIPRGNDKVLTIGTKEIAAAVARVAAVTAEKGSPVKLDVQRRLLIVSSSSEQHNSAREEIETEYAGEPVEVGFNSRYLSDTLAVCGAETVFTMLDGNAPVVVTDPANPAGLFVIMPMRVY